MRLVQGIWYLCLLGWPNL